MFITHQFITSICTGDILPLTVMLYLKCMHVLLMQSSAGFCWLCYLSHVGWEFSFLIRQFRYHLDLPAIFYYTSCTVDQVEQMFGAESNVSATYL